MNYLSLTLLLPKLEWNKLDNLQAWISDIKRLEDTKLDKVEKMQLFDVLPILAVSAVLVRAFPSHHANTTTESYLHLNRGLIYYGTLVNCSNEHNITVENYLWASEKNNTNGSFEQSKCVDACMLRALEILKTDGTINLEKAFEHLLTSRPDIKHETLRENIESCNPKGQDECEIAYKMMVCAFLKDDLP
uniref:Odorant-binding protein 12 n=1 Tax=Encarsia formosa TaxID=32400 RepID=A0A514TTY8_ENCFO|nr:odorant-binding protein 12 [Encarsia formosa]